MNLARSCTVKCYVTHYTTVQVDEAGIVIVAPDDILIGPNDPEFVFAGMLYHIIGNNAPRGVSQPNSVVIVAEIDIQSIRCFIPLSMLSVTDMINPKEH